MMKRLLFVLTLLMGECIAFAAPKTLPPDIIITPGDDAYTIDAVGEGEVYLFCTYKDVITGSQHEEEIELHHAISRTNLPQFVTIRGYAQAAGKEQSVTVYENDVVIPPSGADIPAAPEIVFTLSDFDCIVQAISVDGLRSCLMMKDANGCWAHNDNDYLSVSRGDKELPLQFKAYSMALGQQEYYDENQEITMIEYEYRGYEKRTDYLLPSIITTPQDEPSDLTGLIIFGEPTADGWLPISYSGDEDVILSVERNGEPIELVNGKMQLIPGENYIQVIAAAEGYMPLTADLFCYWEPEEPISPSPQFKVTKGDEYYTVEAVGEGTIYLYLDDYETGNPCVIGRSVEDQIYNFTAYAIIEGFQLSEPAYLELLVPALSQDPPGPDSDWRKLVTITFDDDYCYVTAEGSGKIGLGVSCKENDFNNDDWDFIDQVAEGYGYAQIIIPRTGNSIWSFGATCQVGSESNPKELKDEGYFVVPTSDVSKKEPMIFVLPQKNRYKIQAVPHYIIDSDYFLDHGYDGLDCEQNMQLLMNGEVVENPFYINRLEYDQTYSISAITSITIQRYHNNSLVENIAVPTKRITIPSVVVRAGGENFFIDYEDHVYDDETGVETKLLQYLVNVKYWHPDHAVVQQNHDYAMTAIVPDQIKVEYQDIHEGIIGYNYASILCPFLSEFAYVIYGGEGCFVDINEFCPVTAIADDAFLGNTSLTSIEIGKNVTSIGKDAFKGCSNLAAVTCMATEPPTMTNAATFDAEVYNNATLQVPESSLEKYKTADWWRNFKYINGIVNPNLPGDLNGDGEVGIADVNALVDAILAKDGDGLYDVNGDGEVTIADVTALINLFLSSH